MPIRLKITLLFSAIVILILSIVGAVVYYFWVVNRSSYIDTRLKNLAITTGRFLSRDETFNPRLMQKIDSLTAIAFERKTLQAFDRANNKVYAYNDDDSDSINVTAGLLDEVRNKGQLYKLVDSRDQAFYHYVDDHTDLVIVAAGYDNYGHEALKRLFIILLIGCVLGILIAVVSGYVFSRRLLS